jgi:tRNA-splicing ligase RtcB
MLTSNNYGEKMSLKEKLRKIGPCLWELPPTAKPGMKVPAWLFLSERLLKEVEEGAIEQAANVAFLPGIYKHSIALPDMHFGYGFPIGGVAALDFETGGLSPGGIGFDINCGVRLLRTNLTVEQIKPKLKELLESIFRNVPSGVGEVGKIKLTFSQLDEVLVNGARWAVEHGYGTEKDLEHLEENGCMKGANPEKVSNEARKRGAPQLGTLGAGNHFLEIQKVDKIYLPEVAKVFGIEKEGQVTVLIHTGSRGFGHQVCTDYLRILESSFKEEVKRLPDRELVYAPAGTEECEHYFAAMVCAANYAWTNRHMIMHWVRESFVKVLGMKLEDIGLEVVYDVAHNIAKIEEHEIDGKKVKVFVHRKGATRAFPANHPEIPKDHRKVGQCVLIPGSMGTASYVLVGAETAKETFYSTAHGAGRVSSRAKMLKGVRGEEVAKRLAQKGILSRPATWRVMAEEAPEAYKDIDEVARVTEEAGISRRVARLVPIGVVKG